MTKRSPNRSAAARRFLSAAGLTEGTFEAAAEIVVETLLDGIACPPTDLAAVATLLNVKALEEKSLPASGELRRDGGALVISYSSDMPPVRQRFTIAHELGHAFMEGTGPRPPQVGADLERICDVFAAELLLPTRRVRAFLGSDPTVSDVLSLARKFEVSREAGAHKVRDLLGLEFVELSRNGDISFHTWGVPRLDWAVEEVLESVRGGDVARGELRLPRNRVWNGGWLFEASPVRRDRVLVLLRPDVPAV